MLISVINKLAESFCKRFVSLILQNWRSLNIAWIDHWCEGFFIFYQFFAELYINELIKPNNSFFLSITFIEKDMKRESKAQDNDQIKSIVRVYYLKESTLLVICIISIVNYWSAIDWLQKIPICIQKVEIVLSLDAIQIWYLDLMERIVVKLNKFSLRNFNKTSIHTDLNDFIKTRIILHIEHISLIR
jgi:hypothetical protein